MATSLQMVNDLKGLLREERVGTLAAPDDNTVELLALINKSARLILEGNTWPFDKRRDEALVFPPRITGTVGTATLDSTTAIFSTVSTTTAWETSGSLTFPQLNMVCRCSITDADVNPNTSYLVTSGVRATTALTVTLDRVFEGTTDSGGAVWELYAYEKMLPSTVRKVLSVRHEEQPLDLIEIDRELTFDQAVPRPQIEFSENPRVVYVGATVITTFDTASTANTGNGIMVWPIPDAIVTLHYTYLLRHTEFTSASDTTTFVNVDDVVNDLIVDRAYAMALMSDIGNDPTRARSIELETRLRTKDLLRSTRRDPGRRRIARPFGFGHARHYRSRWDSQLVPSP